MVFVYAGRKSFEGGVCDILAYTSQGTSTIKHSANIAKDMVLIQVVEKDGFKQLLNTSDPRYTLPG